ncbi:hypothetical protein QFC20_004248 [Naganishia adeliensis]|uniref:Uncharacterized protein n=1 Tax=Naganishia adeliensis TaxID=92952 RepID=A0ACC2W4J4_9TREE|nr:hypothetical protein QFC20_004248 [Naganishia adeliensis]
MPGSSVTPDGSTQLFVGQYMQEILDGADRTFSDELNALTARHSGVLTRDASACVANVGKAMCHVTLSQLSQDASKFDSVMGTEHLSTESSQAIEEFLVRLGELVGLQRNVLSIIQTTLTTSKTEGDSRQYNIYLQVGDEAEVKVLEFQLEVATSAVQAFPMKSEGRFRRIGRGNKGELMAVGQKFRYELSKLTFANLAIRTPLAKHVEDVLMYATAKRQTRRGLRRLQAGNRRSMVLKEGSRGGRRYI